MKNIALIVVILLLNSCTQVVYLKKVPSEIVLTSINSYSSKKFNYSFTSDLPDSFIIGSYAFDVNETYKSNIKVYMNTKFTIDSTSVDNISFHLLSCELSVRDANSALQNTVNVPKALNGDHYGYYNNVAITAKVIIELKVVVGDETYSKNIIVEDEYTGENYGYIILKNSLESVIGKSIILIDKYLSSILSQ